MAWIGKMEAVMTADTSDFRAKMDQAGKSVNKFKEQMEKFGLGFLGFSGLTMAFRAILDYVRDLENPLDENVRRAKRFAEGFDQAKIALLDIGAQALGVVNSLGEWWGEQIAILRYGKEQVALGEKIQRQTEETLAAIAKDKKITEEIVALRKERLDVEKRSAEEKQKALPVEERLIAAEDRLLAAVKEQANASSNKLATAKADLEVSKARADLQKVQAEVTKKQAEEDKKTAAERKKADDEHVKVLQEIDGLKWDRLSTEEKIQATTESIYSTEQLIAERKKDGANIDEETLILMKLQDQQGKLIAENVKERADEEKKVTKELEKQNDALRTSFEIRGRYNEDLSDRILIDKIATIEADISARRAKATTQATNIYDPLASFQQQQLDAARQKLAARQNASRLVARYGEEGAARFFSGNMPEYERLLSLINPDEIKKQTSLLDQVNRRLEQSGLFPLR